ncbi:hypothetical protein ACO0R3_003179 [Hanseniaspora guilliermondii]
MSKTIVNTYKYLNMDSTKIINIVLAIFLPPLAVFMIRDCTRDFYINLVLTIFFFFPGMLHALFLVLNE